MRSTPISHKSEAQSNVYMYIFNVTAELMLYLAWCVDMFKDYLI